MSQRTEYAPGTFSWADLMTGDLEAAKEFYAGLFGWEYEISETPQGPYVMAHLDGKAVAGLGPQSEQEAQMGIPPHWNTYISVESADATAAKAAELGGTVVVPPLDAMDAGRMAFISAPGGEAFGIWEPRNHIGAGVVNEHGAVGWVELASRDVEGAKSFYTELLGWTAETGESPTGEGEYTSVMVGERMNAGMLAMNENWPPDVPAYWSIYIYVDDLDAAIASTKELGGTVIMPRMDIPEVGGMAVIQDPTGAALSIMEPSDWDTVD